MVKISKTEKNPTTKHGIIVALLIPTIIFAYLIINPIESVSGSSIFDDIIIDTPNKVRGGGGEDGIDVTSGGTTAGATGGSGFGSLAINENRLGDGCYHVFLDIGANVGVHGRFLLEPHEYPDAVVAYSMFSKMFGVPRDSRNICVFAFEPNPIHKQRLTQLQHTYQDVLGLRYHSVLSGVGISDEPLTFYRQDGGRNNDWGFSTTPHLGREKRREAVVVPVVRLASWIRQHITDRIIPQHSDLPEPKVVMKLDVEGYEYALLPDLLLTGVLCDAVDYVFGEFHHHFANMQIPENKEANLPPFNVTASNARAYMKDIMSKFKKLKSTTPCRTGDFVQADDESYLFDTIPLPTTREQFRYVSQPNRTEFCGCPKCTLIEYGSSLKPMISCNERIEFFQNTYKTPYFEACAASVKQGYCPTECDSNICRKSV